jgi:hypothetical protein
MKTFSAALSISRAAANGDAAIGKLWMSNLLHDVLAQDGGFMGLSDAGFDARCVEYSRYVDAALARAAFHARTIKWPRTEEDEAERKRWDAAYALNRAMHGREQILEAAE